MRTLVNVLDLHVVCALELGSTNYRTRCNDSADSGVVYDDGAVYWRCPTHMAVRRVDENDEPTELGHVATMVAINKD